MSNTLKLGNGQWATGKDTILAYNDLNSNYKPLSFSFSRDSSATVVNKDGLIETVGSGEPRIDFKDNTKGALLLEPERRNILLQSNQFDTTWTIGASALDLTSGQSGVYGSNDAWLLKKNSTGARYIEQSLSLSSAQYSYSVYLKAESTNWVFLWSYDGSASVNAYFDLENGVVGQTGGAALNGTNIESVGNGWYRCTLTYTHAPDSIRIYPADANESISPSDDNGIYIQHAQLEVGRYPTSIINTSGSAVTRVADSSSQTLPSSVFNSYPFSVFVEVDVVDTSSGYAFSLLKSTSSAEYFTIEYFSNVWHITARPDGSTQRTTSTTTVTKGTHKIVGVWESSSMKLYLNGSLIASGSNSQSFNSQVNSMLLGQLRISGDTNSRNTVRQTELYNNALTDAEAIALTTI
jgi:hypothetical protein